MTREEFEAVREAAAQIADAEARKVRAAYGDGHVEIAGDRIAAAIRALKYAEPYMIEEQGA